MRLLPRRKPADLTATVVYASAILYPECSGRVCYTWLQVPLETAHDIANEPVVKVYSYCWGDGVEQGWEIDVVALVEAEAEELMAQARGGLLADIAAGRIAKGTHNDKWGQALSSSDRREQVLVAFWRAELVRVGERVQE